jgi:hypothetical protein
VNDDLTLAAAALARAAPTEWDVFKKAVRRAETGARDNMVRASTDLAKFQGMALQCGLFAQGFDDALAAADRIEQRKKQAAR